ncbi:MBL fold metallo-hydrolase [Pseudomonas sp. CCI3.2]|uniref:MBL fold metallo-hydrolase n=1 Tax=unclassified Pseudomonas TaxID=196821 RepID=UPI002AC97F7C|nr:MULTISPECIES: MBL fold metallo-hydrolase [unclassified Pseudomonas]MEB0077288.1 MBL fold metallo-hydrolase [Pseudomonas sp. MH10out]MEB0091381.1 MBL fold metallo-hydrolase [Pseudomonas sp. CCI4.2]MEB0104486.1 MBL fold metallo-hydrolase [Pseudomonas sp. CCI3.2]MEB0129249.1 MBL fold metallo-hydrolase [Pseudomonas sp. CCI2.4]MEB0157499.1 MBL fold metallo-hydrolase [Pseudomonas sp. AH2 (2023)]
MKNTNVYRVGDLRITKITEQIIRTLTARQLYPDATAALLKSLTGVAEVTQYSAVEMSVHSWLVETPHYRLLIDTATGNGKERPFSNLFHHLNSPWMENLTLAGVRPSEIDYVLHTHLHVDHVGWNTVRSGDLWVPTFVNATYVCSNAEMEFYESPAAASRMMIFEDSVRPVRDAGQLEVIDDQGGEYLPGIKFHPTPGHSAGHMSISIESGNEIALFCGDVMHSPLQVAFPDWNSMFCGEQLVARQSRKRLLDQACIDRTTVFTSHFNESSVGRVTEAEGRYSWEFI